MDANTNRRRQVHTSIRDHSAESSLFIRRALVSFVMVLVLFGILLGNLYRLQVVRYDDYQTRSNHNRIKLLPVSPIRGLIYDRNGIELAINRTIYQLEVIPDKVKNLEELFEQLRLIIDLTDDDIAFFNKERKKSRRFTAVVLKQSLTEEQIARFSINQHRYPDFEIKGYQRRYYPYGSAAAHVLGYVSKINDKDLNWLTESDRIKDYLATQDIGKQGIEKYYEHLLHGQSGSEQVEVNSRGRVIRRLNDEPPQAGQDIYLTIDIKLQLYIEKILNGRKAAIVVSDPRDGSILALVSSPSYDPNLFVNGISTKDYAVLRDNTNRPLFNRATQGTYPPASTVKPYIATAALAENLITSETSINDPGWWRLPTNKNKGPCTTADLNQGCYRDWNRWGRKGSVNVLQAIEFSSDTFFYQMAFDIGINSLSRWMKSFGYGEYTGIDLFEESRGLMPTREWKQSRHRVPWYQGDTISVGIGQGYWISTPLQMNKALVTLINRGQIKTPHLLLNSRSSDQTQNYIDTNNAQLGTIDANYWQIVKQAMYNVIHGNLGSGRKAFEGALYEAAGKSGTAQVFGLNKGNYNAATLPEYLHDHALFIAYAPYENPTVAISVVIENGGGGGKTAGPIVRKIFDYVLLNQDDKNLKDVTLTQ